VNPRVYASISLAVASGANLVGLYCDLLRGIRVPFTRARTGVFYRWLEGDIRFVTDRFRKRKITLAQAMGALRPHRHIAWGGPESLRDPGPMLARARFVARRAATKMAAAPCGVSPPR